LNTTFCYSRNDIVCGKKKNDIVWKNLCQDQMTPTNLISNVTLLNKALMNSNFRKSTVGLEDYII
jgi:hypothetical protein